jgi:hypothetical protein
MRSFSDAISNFEIGTYTNKKIIINAKDKTPLRTHTPRMYMPFGISGFVPEVGQTKYNVEFSMKGWNEEGNYVKNFYDSIRALENLVILEVVQQSVDIFGEAKTYGDVQSMFNSNIKEDPEREPKFRVKVDTTYDSRIKPLIIDPEKNDIRKEVTNGLYARNTGIAKVEMNSVYFLNKKFGITWKLHQLMVFEPQRLKGFQFIEST